MNTRMIKSVACTAALLWLLGLSGSAVGYGHLPRLDEASPDDFVCISGYVYDAGTQEPLVGVGVCVFPEGFPADTSVSAGVIHENGIEYPLPPLPGFHWITYTDRSGSFSVCVIPVRLAGQDFSAAVYKPGYVPQFPEQIPPESGQNPLHEYSISLVPSEQ